LPAGLTCTPDYTGVSPTGAFCQLPGPFFFCFPLPGCAPGLTCVDADDAGDPGGCLASCTTTADCTDPLTACGPFEGSDQSFCLVNNCDNFWQACPASVPAGNDGTCVYLYTDPVDGPQGGCLQGGSVPNGGACNYYRSATASLCANGTLCMIDFSAQNSGVCFPDCDAVSDGGPACLADCVVQTPPAPPPAVSELDYFTQAGGCAQDCSESQSCPSSLSCQQVGPGTAACLP
jgi:hypothetical protein